MVAPPDHSRLFPRPKGLPPERVQPSRRGKPLELKESQFYGNAPAKASATAPVKKGAKSTDEDSIPEAPSELSLQYTFDRIDQVAEKASLAKVSILLPNIA